MTDSQEGEGLHGVRMDYSEEVMEAEREMELMSKKIIEAMRMAAPSYAQQGMSDGDWQQVLKAVIEAAAEEYGGSHKFLSGDKAAILDRILSTAYPVGPHE